MDSLDQRNVQDFFWGVGRLFGLSILFYLEYMKYMLRELQDKTSKDLVCETVELLHLLLVFFTLGIQIFIFFDGFTPTLMWITSFLIHRSDKIARLLLWTLRPSIVTFIVCSSMVFQIIHLCVLILVMNEAWAGKRMMCSVLCSTPSDSVQSSSVYRAINGSFYSVNR